MQLLTHRLKEFDITPEQLAVLIRLSKQDGINQKEIAHRAAKDQPTTARILDVLSKKGLIHKQLSPTDRRAFLVYLTNKGKDLTEQMIPIESQMIADISAGIESDQLEQFSNVLLHILRNAESLVRE